MSCIEQNLLSNKVNVLMIFVNSYIYVLTKNTVELKRLTYPPGRRLFAFAKINRNSKEEK